ncbi:MAG: urease accessory protein UreF [Bacteroidales bacterium]|nr:MAG: urease accessory protein UreF [Bacteroidales bacterium]
MSSASIISTMRLLEMSDSQFPVGNFSFSNGLETASYEKIVHDAETLRQYVEAASIQSAFSDGIASIQAYRAINDNNYNEVLHADEEVILCKMNDEARQMVLRMGKKMAELIVHITDCPMMARFLNDINAGVTAGTYPVAQAIAMHHAGISEEEMFTSQQFGVINMILGAALRCVRVSHYDTQKIAYEMAQRIAEDYIIVKDSGYEDMRAFVPGIDMMASLHEKGNMRMFMN